MTHTLIPSPNIVRKILSPWTDLDPLSIERFTTGNHHYVYDVTLSDKSKLVVRMTTQDEKNAMEGAYYWNLELSKMQIPLPKILHSDLDFEFPYLILERFPGKDLGFVIPQMTNIQLAKLAKSLMGYQKLVTSLPHNNRFGYAINATVAPLKSWLEVLESSVLRSEKRIKQTGFVNPICIKKVRELLKKYEGSLAKVKATPFLHDITTKNVIINDQGELSGIVDVDDLCFGDPLFHIALTQMAFLSGGNSLDYIDLLLKEASFQCSNKILNLYTSICCVDFLGEIGQTFNGNRVDGSVERKHKLENILESLWGQSLLNQD